MEREHLTRFLNLLGVPSEHIQTSEGEVWLRCGCPLARETHAHGIDTNPSFGVTASEPGGFSGYKCFTCGEGSLYDLTYRYTSYFGQQPILTDFVFLHEGAEDEESIGFADPYNFTAREVREPEPVPLEVLDLFPVLTHGDPEWKAKKVRDWLFSRGIHPAVWEKYEIRYSKESDAVIFPLMYNGLVWALHVRSLWNKFFYYIKPEHLGRKDIRWGRGDIWFGQQYYDPTKPVYLVESVTDKLRLESLTGLDNVLASCGPIGAMKLSKIHSPVTYLAYDSDEPGAAFCKKTIKLIGDRTDLYRLSWAEVGIKDAGDLKKASEYDLVWSKRRQILLGEGGMRVVLVNDLQTGVEDRYATAYPTD